MKKTLLWGISFLTAFGLILFVACQSPSSTQPPGQAKEDPSFALDIQPILSNNCTVYSCHGAANQARMTLVEGRAYGNIVNVTSKEVPSRKRILPFEADHSFLVIKIEGRQTAGARMPAAKDRLAHFQIQTIKNWVHQGAKNN